METKDIRRTNLKVLLNASELKQADFAGRCGLAPSVISQLINGHRNLGDTLARKIEEAFAVQRGWLDIPHGEKQKSADSVEGKTEKVIISVSLDEDEERLLEVFNRLPRSEKVKMINEFEARAEELESLFDELVSLKSTKSPLK